ncbi:uncharacterized protein BYT42DRAFT_559998 [Radiomyces spectabilis]|uniref:uncharacterized protein n=1 Tax=Radiomyces spectabilis TaxID=64574 RepID=UPI002220FD6A|nr:uncharacterized protein BYT42DRAFT_559998 [Radiomyces spectabilis]KAI8388421.1 hypothetical protein BYT42DRAFT_559998 [Radiomyces spectabilis]
MTKTLPTQDSVEAKRWLIIGAYQAGASEKHVARIAGISRTAVRHIILNYQRTGSPSLPKQEPLKAKLKPVVEYDENGNLIESDDEDSEQDHGSSAWIDRSPKEIQKSPIHKSPKLNKTLTTKQLLAYVSEQMQTTKQQSAEASTSESWRPLTPPRDSRGSISSDKSPPQLPSSAISLPPSPPLNSVDKSVPKAPPSISKFDQTIKGYEIWTHEDDMVLVDHVLTRLQGGRWRELEAKLGGRHNARLCRERWQFLRKLLLKGINNKPEVPSAWTAKKNNA